MQKDQVTCKKCGGLHGIDIWRGVEFYYCPKGNRILLLNKLDGLKTENKEVSNGKQNADS